MRLSPSSAFRYGGGAAGGQGSTVDPFIGLKDPTSASNLQRLRAAIAPLGIEILAWENLAITGSTAVASRLPR